MWLFIKKWRWKNDIKNPTCYHWCFLRTGGSSFCQSAKARDTITMTLEDYKHMGEILHSLPIRERHKSLKGKDVALYRCPKCKSYVAEWTEVCECGNRLDWGESEDLHVNNDKR